MQFYFLILHFKIALKKYERCISFTTQNLIRSKQRKAIFIFAKNLPFQPNKKQIRSVSGQTFSRYILLPQIGATAKNNFGCAIAKAHVSYDLFAHQTIRCPSDTSLLETPLF